MDINNCRASAPLAVFRMATGAVALQILQNNVYTIMHSLVSQNHGRSLLVRERESPGGPAHDQPGTSETKAPGVSGSFWLYPGQSRWNRCLQTNSQNSTPEQGAAGRDRK